MTVDLSNTEILESCQEVLPCSDSLENGLVLKVQVPAAWRGCSPGFQFTHTTEVLAFPEPSLTGTPQYLFSTSYPWLLGSPF